MSAFKKHIDAMSAYVPGTQPDDMSRIVKLNQNENPYPPSPAVAEALRSFDPAGLRLYPDAMAGEFRRTVARVLDVPEASVLPGDGSDDLIIMIARAVAGPGRPIAYPVPTFPFYFTQGQIEDAPLIEVPAHEDFSLPIDALARTNAAVTFLANPNSPTGAMADMEQIDWLANKLHGVLVIDEAYADFAGATAAPLIGRRANVLVMRTLSKGYSLAGLRLGFALAGPALMDGLLKTKAIYNVGAIPAAVGAAALADQAYHRQCVEKILAQRQRLAGELSGRGLRVWPSRGNFLMVSVPGGNAQALYERLKARGVLVRYFDQPRMHDKLRISIGTEQDTDALLGGLDA